MEQERPMCPCGCGLTRQEAMDFMERLGKSREWAEQRMAEMEKMTHD